MGRPETSDEGFQLKASMHSKPRFASERKPSSPAIELYPWAKIPGAKTPSSVLERRDEIGILGGSLETMRREIEEERRELEDRTRILEAMRCIDVAVREDPPMAELYDRILEALTAYAGARMAVLALRDPDGGGFAVVASRSAGSEKAGQLSRSGGFLPDELLPDSLLVRLFDPFEIPCSRLKTDISLPWGDDPVDAVFDCLFVNLPFEAKGFLSGSIFLLRPAGGPELSQIRILADVAGAAIGALAAREKGERNWRAIVKALVRAVDAKSRWTWGHSQRVATLSLAMGRRLLMDEREIERLEIAAFLHDVGKIGVSETILDKPGALEPHELASVREHPSIGAEIVADAPSYSEVRAAILSHHECWDGSGYPEGLSGENIPLAARIIALADVWDAITSERPYRKAMSIEEARSFIADRAGKAFDARLVRIFLDEIADKSASSDSQMEVL